LKPQNSLRYIFGTADCETAATEQLDPACVFLPNTTAKVARAVALFNRLNCKFATRGGGHSPIPGAANINGGILIGTNRLNKIEINHARGYVRVGAGNRLGAVYNALDPHNLVSVIGRYETVGLGLALAAGVSFLSNREGLAVDNVVNYEVVIANGTVINANRRNHPNLFWALKGGGNNFGVVTHYDLRTFPTNGTIYGGNIRHPESSFDQVNDVFYDYHTHQAVDDVLTHAMPSYDYVGATDTAGATTLLTYNAPVDKLPPIMQPWTQTPYESHTLSQRTYSSIASELGDGILDNLSLVYLSFFPFSHRRREFRAHGLTDLQCGLSYL
jgi:FAD/FMN-containing dehydrogenase